MTKDARGLTHNTRPPNVKFTGLTWTGACSSSRSDDGQLRRRSIATRGLIAHADDGNARAAVGSCVCDNTRDGAKVEQAARSEFQ